MRFRDLCLPAALVASLLCVGFTAMGESGCATHANAPSTVNLPVSTAVPLLPLWNDAVTVPCIGPPARLRIANSSGEPMTVTR
jgi:hypothetical protein